MNILQRSSTKSNKFMPVLAVVLFSLALPQEVAAQSFFVGNCIELSTNNFLDNEPVCANGTTGGNPIFSPNALVCVLPSTGGGPDDDVTPGGCNSFPPAFTMIDEPVWLPPTTPGTYIAVLFASDDSVFQEGIVISPSPCPECTTINVDAIKEKAGVAAATWEATALFGANISTFHSAFSYGVAAATGNIVSIVVSIAGEVLGIPTSYDGEVAKIGGEIIAVLATSQQARYKTLHDDPPDSLFTDFVPVDIAAINAENATLAPLLPLVPLQYPFGNLSQDPLHLASMRLANSMTEEAALVFAVTRTLEKFQGAEAAGDDEFTLLQARAVKKYADQLGTQLTTTRQGALDYKAELTADDLAAFVYDGDEFAALTTRLLTSGLTAAEEQSLRDGGFIDADFTVMFDHLNTFPVPNGTYSLGGGLDDIVASIDGTLPVLQTLGDEAQAVVDHFTPLVTVQHPSADAGEPYAGNEGTAVNFDGSGSSDPQAQALTYEWDFDLDGQFDDAVGAMVTNSYNAPIATQVGLRVTDTDGNVDIAYAAVSIAEVNFPPQITSFIPVDLAPTASNQNPLDFSATATDPDLDAVNFEWRVDGDVVSTASGFTYTPAIGETGTRTVRLTVSDLNPLSEDTFETRLVHLEQERIFADGFE